MKSKIICLILSTVILASFVFAGCSTGSGSAAESTNPEDVDRPPVSVNLFIITDESTTPEAMASVEEAFNKITNTKLTTYVDLVFCTKDEYEDIINSRFKAKEDADAAAEAAKKEAKAIAASLKAAGITTVATTVKETETEITEAETIKNEYGVDQYKYPTIPESQIDILMVYGYEQLSQLVEAERLLRLDDEISSTGRYKVINDYVPTAMMKYSKINGMTYGIPVNHVIGEYTYLLINKEMADKYYLDVASITNIADCDIFIENLAASETICPILANVSPDNISYWNSDLGNRSTFSILASFVGLTAEQNSTGNSQVSITNPFQIRQFTSHYSQMMKYQEKGYFSKNPETEENFGVAVIKGDYATRLNYQDKYYVKVIKNPVADDKEISSAFFAVSSYTGNLSRSMEVITQLTTNSKLINVLQYGVEGIHYEKTEDGRIDIISDAYKMELGKTGNVFLTTPTTDMDADIWEYGKLQNMDAKVSVFAGLSSVWGNVNKDRMKEIENISASYYERLLACKTTAELEEFFETAKNEILLNQTYLDSVKKDEGEIDTPLDVYVDWYNKLWPPESVS